MMSIRLSSADPGRRPSSAAAPVEAEPHINRSDTGLVDQVAAAAHLPIRPKVSADSDHPPSLIRRAEDPSPPLTVHRPSLS
jgi:hypothetical protein